jgi:sodium/bile acid cotransporter 7
MIQLGSTVLLPLIFGQLARKVAGNWARNNASFLGILSQAALLLVIYSTFCDTFIAETGHLEASDVLLAVLLGMLLPD